VLVERAMRKKPEERFQSARDLRDALVAVEQEVAPAEAAIKLMLEAAGLSDREPTSPRPEKLQ